MVSGLRSGNRDLVMVYNHLVTIWVRDFKGYTNSLGALAQFPPLRTPMYATEIAPFRTPSTIGPEGMRSLGPRIGASREIGKTRSGRFHASRGIVLTHHPKGAKQHNHLRARAQTMPLEPKFTVRTKEWCHWGLIIPITHWETGANLDFSFLLTYGAPSK